MSIITRQWLLVMLQGSLVSLVALIMESKVPPEHQKRLVFKPYLLHNNTSYYYLVGLLLLSVCLRAEVRSVEDN